VVAEEGVVMEWDAAPESDQLAKTYCVPVEPGWVAAAMVWEEPGAHWKGQGEVQAVLSTVRESPAGELATVKATELRVKLAVTEAGALRVRFCGEVVPERAPENPEKE
jgi:hypothetical protein